MSENQSLFGPREARFLVEEQCACWELAHNNIEALDKIQTRELSVGKETVRLQGAFVDSGSGREDAGHHEPHNQLQRHLFQL